MMSFDDFSIFVNGLIIVCELSDYQQIKYYKLCCIIKSHSFKRIFSRGLTVNWFPESSPRRTISRMPLELPSSQLPILTWDKTLKSFEGLGMNVGFLRARFDQLMNLSRKSIRYKEAKLGAELAKVTETLNRLDTEIRSYEQENDDDLEALFQKVANAPWWRWPLKSFCDGTRSMFHDEEKLFADIL